MATSASVTVKPATIRRPARFSRSPCALGDAGQSVSLLMFLPSTYFCTGPRPSRGAHDLIERHQSDCQPFHFRKRFGSLADKMCSHLGAATACGIVRAAAENNDGHSGHVLVALE